MISPCRYNCCARSEGLTGVLTYACTGPRYAAVTRPREGADGVSIDIRGERMQGMHEGGEEEVCAVMTPRCVKRGPAGNPLGEMDSVTTTRPMACPDSRYWQEQQLMEELIMAERRAKLEHQCEPEAKSLPNTPTADPAGADPAGGCLLAPQYEICREVGETANTQLGAPSKAQICAPPPIVSGDGRVCAPLVFAASAPANERCSRGSRSVVESIFITKRQHVGAP